MSRTTDYLDGFELNASRGGWSPDAFNCQACPKAGCPLWWRLVSERTEDGVVREQITEGCGAALAPALMVRLLMGQHLTEKVLDEKTKEIVEAQQEQKAGIAATLKGILVIAAQKSGNPVAVAIAPMLPRLLGKARRLLPGKRRGR